jgi:hypothetical protein
VPRDAAPGDDDAFGGQASSDRCIVQRPRSRLGGDY